LAKLHPSWASLVDVFSREIVQKEKVRNGGRAREPNQKNQSTETVNEVYGRRTEAT
jgi:hypothetical protein